MQIRPMLPEDVAAAERVSADAFYDLDMHLAPLGAPEPERRSAEHGQQWIRQTTRLLGTDADGCWVAADETGMLGFATSVRREKLWILSTFTVRPSAQGKGTGKTLLNRVLEHGLDCDRGMFESSGDQLALRRYHAAGFRLYPQMYFEGTIDRAVIPAVTGIIAGTPVDWEWMDDLDRELRGAPHGPDHQSLLDMGRLLISDTRDGYAYCTPSGPALVTARDEETASRLLWESLASIEGKAALPHVTSFNMWAADIALRARLSMHHLGYLALRNMAPPAPYLHNGLVL